MWCWKTREEQLLVSETVLVGNAAGILSRAGEHTAHLVPCLNAHIEHVAATAGLGTLPAKAAAPWDIAAMPASADCGTGAPAPAMPVAAVLAAPAMPDATAA